MLDFWITSYSRLQLEVPIYWFDPRKAVYKEFATLGSAISPGSLIFCNHFEKISVGTHLNFDTWSRTVLSDLNSSLPLQKKLERNVRSYGDGRIHFSKKNSRIFQIRFPFLSIRRKWKYGQNFIYIQNVSPKMFHKLVHTFSRIYYQ